MPARDSLAGATVRGSLYNLGAAGVTITLGFVRAVILARLLLPADFGLVALALVFVNLVAQARNFGLDEALLYAQADAGPRYETHLALKLLLAGAGGLVLLVAAPLVAGLYPGQALLAPAIVALAAASVGEAANQTQETLLGLRLRFRSLATVNVASAVVMTIVAPALAWLGFGPWALVAEYASGIATRLILVWGPLRQAPPRPRLHREHARFFWQYGRHNWLAGGAGYLTDRFDDFWIGTTLGQTPLGFYARAYDFAHYPRRLIANPLVGVLRPVFARLQSDRLRLSQAYFRLMSLLTRAGFLAGGLLILLAPEFVAYVLGERWLPMVRAFQLMVAYVLLDPLVQTAADLLLATGRPAPLARARLVQLAFFVPAVIAGAAWLGIEGVALAADAMLLIGFVLLLRTAREVADFSAARMFRTPSVAVALGFGVASVVIAPASISEIESLAGAALKAALFTGPFCLVVLLVDRREVLAMLRLGWDLVRRRTATPDLPE